MSSYAPGPLPPTTEADVFAIMKEVGVSSLTLKDIRNRLQDMYKVDLVAQKDALTAIVTKTLARPDFKKALTPRRTVGPVPSKAIRRANAKADRERMNMPDLVASGGVNELDSQVSQINIVDQQQHQQVPITTPQQQQGLFPTHHGMYPPGSLPRTVDRDVLAIMRVSNMNTLTVMDIQNQLTHKYRRDISLQYPMLSSVVSRVLASQVFQSMLQERASVSSSSSPLPSDARPSIQAVAPPPPAYSDPLSKVGLGYPIGMDHLPEDHAGCDKELDEYKHTINTLSERVKKLEEDAVLRDEQYARMAALLEAVLSNHVLRTAD